jgi:hypothetical protein
LDWIEDGGVIFNFKEVFNDGFVFFLWIGAGCSGCYDWIEFI